VRTTPLRSISRIPDSTQDLEGITGGPRRSGAQSAGPPANTPQNISGIVDLVTHPWVTRICESILLICALRTVEDELLTARCGTDVRRLTVLNRHKRSIVRQLRRRRMHHYGVA